MSRPYWNRFINYLNDQWYALEDMVKALGTRLSLFILLAQGLMKGIIFGGGSGGIVGLPILFLFKSYTNEYKGLTAIQIQIYKNIATSSWALKPIIGIVSDTMPILGYHKLPYISITVFLATVSCLLMAVLWPLPPNIVTCLLFFIFLACATTDLLTESRYSEKINEHPSQSASVTTFVSLCIFIGQIVSTIPIGIMLEFIQPHYLYYIPIAPLVLILFPVYFNWVGDPMCINTQASAEKHERFLLTFRDGEGIVEDVEVSSPDPTPDMITNCIPMWWFYYDFNDDGLTHDIYNASGDALPPTSTSSEEDDVDMDGLPVVATPVIGIKGSKICREWRLILLAICIAIISISTSILGILQVNTLYICGASLLGNIMMIIGFQVLIGGITAQIQTYVMIQNMFSLSISSAEFFFLTDTVTQYAEGPHFSKSFFVVAMGLVASLCAIAGSVSYMMFMQHWKIRSVFYFGNSISVVLGLLNVVFYKRWNRLIGFPDQPFLLGSEALQVIVTVWCDAPVKIMMSKLCKKNVESITFALLAGSSNLGSSLSQYTGATLLSLLGVNPSGAVGESAQFENLWLASLITTLLPIITLIAIPFLIPDIYQDDKLLDLDNESGPRLKIEEYYIHDNSYEDADKFIADSDSYMTDNEDTL